MEQLDLATGIIGGVLIGLGAATFLVLAGRIAGISGLLAGVLQPRSHGFGWQLAFLAGLGLGALLVGVLVPLSISPVVYEAGTGLTIISGLLVGFGARLGGGCTSGHGVCGVSRLAKRSLVATGVFFATAVLTVYLTRHIWGAGS